MNELINKIGNFSNWMFRKFNNVFKYRCRIYNKEDLEDFKITSFLFDIQRIVELMYVSVMSIIAGGLYHISLIEPLGIFDKCMMLFFMTFLAFRLIDNKRYWWVLLPGLLISNNLTVQYIFTVIIYCAIFTLIYNWVSMIELSYQKYKINN